MQEEFNKDYQYNSCVSRGVCSINPKIASMQEVLLIYLKSCAYYELKLSEKNTEINEKLRNLILNTIVAMVSNPHFSEKDFNLIVRNFNEYLPKLSKEYKKYFNENGIIDNSINKFLRNNKDINLPEMIKMGEKTFLQSLKTTPQDILNMYKIAFNVAKSICTNILEIQYYTQVPDNYYLEILNLLNMLNSNNKKIDSLTEYLIKITDINNNLMNCLYREQVKRYGEQQEQLVSYSTTPSKTVLVAGSNLRELEIILEAFKDTEIDIYTHDEMIVAHTFPAFSEYKNLKGQYGQGLENCLLDFATFPGPIILTKNSLHNVDNLYRGRLYTTDCSYSKGVTPIVDYDYTDVIISAQEAKGFKKGKSCESEIVGFNYNSLIANISKTLSEKSYSNIFVVGLNGYTQEQQEYYRDIIKKSPDDVLIISLDCCKQKDNVICINSNFDRFAFLKLIQELVKLTNIPISLFCLKCNRHTISQIIYLKKKTNINIFVGNCAPIEINPSLIQTLEEKFNIWQISNFSNDLERIYNN